WFKQVGDGQIHVVAAQQDVVADREPFDIRAGATMVQLEEAEIRRAATDIDHQNMMRSGRAIAKTREQVRRRVVPLQPAVERRLRLLQQSNALRKAGLPGGRERQALRDGVERRRNGYGDLLGIEEEIGTRVAKPGVPGGPQKVEDQRRRAQRRDLAV